MDIHELSPQEGARRKTKRVGRGTGSGLGKTSAEDIKDKKPEAEEE